MKSLFAFIVFTVITVVTAIPAKADRIRWDHGPLTCTGGYWCMGTFFWTEDGCGNTTSSWGFDCCRGEWFYGVDHTPFAGMQSADYLPPDTSLITVRSLAGIGDVFTIPVYTSASPNVAGYIWVEKLTGSCEVNSRRIGYKAGEWSGMLN